MTTYKVLIRDGFGNTVHQHQGTDLDYAREVYTYYRTKVGTRFTEAELVQVLETTRPKENS